MSGASAVLPRLERASRCAAPAAAAAKRDTRREERSHGHVGSRGKCLFPEMLSSAAPDKLSTRPREPHAGRAEARSTAAGLHSKGKKTTPALEEAPCQSRRCAQWVLATCSPSSRCFRYP